MLTTFETITATTTAISLLFGGGLCKAFLGQSNRQAVQRYEIDQMKKSVDEHEQKHNKKDTEIALLTRDVQALEEAVRRLDDIPKILTATQLLAQRVESIENSMKRLEDRLKESADK